MPIEFQKVFTIQIPVHVRKKPNGVYEARFRARGYHICVSSTNYEKLKPKFLEALAHYRPQSPKTEEPQAPQEPPKSLYFRDVAARWLELKRPTVKARTFKDYIGIFGANILPVFGGRELREIKQSDVQALINGYIEKGKMRTAVKIFQTLNAVFRFALGDELIDRSPMRMLQAPVYEEEQGEALTPEEEREFLEKLEASKCSEPVRKSLLFLLYTGIRRSELASAQIEGGFVRVICSKVRKGYKERQRLIPVTPMLAQILPPIDLDILRTVRPDALTQAMKRLMPAHHLHDLRHTFITRCQECGVAREVVSVWAGHAPDNTMTSNVYTHFSREFMESEGKKVHYALFPTIEVPKKSPQA